MKDFESKLENDPINKDKVDWDLHKIADQILCDLNGSVPLSVIQETLEQVAPKYESARIQTFVPIFIRREAVKRLKTRQASFTVLEMELTRSEESIELRPISVSS